MTQLEDRWIDALALVDQQHWLYRERAERIAATLERWGPFRAAGLRLLDVGCGPGGTTAELATYGTITAVDPSTASRRWVAQRIPDARFVLGGVAQLDELLGAESFDVVSTFTSLYHRGVADPDSAIESLASRVATGGVLMIEEPADMRLWRQQDVVSDSGRRFRLEQLVGPCESAGLRVEASRYLHSWAWPGARLLAIRDARWPPGADANATELDSPLLDAVGARLERIEQAALRRRYTPRCGTGCWVVATRN